MSTNMQEPNFKRWFGNSKVVDNSGDPLIVYHGSKVDFDKFDNGKIGSNTDNGIFGKGFYFTTNINTAKSYGGVVKTYYLSIKNPLILDSTQTIAGLSDYLGVDDSILHVRNSVVRPFNSFINTFSGEVKYKGHDGVIVKRDNTNHLEIVAFYPNQIKSATDNNGEFSTSSDNIYESNYNREEQNKENTTMRIKLNADQVKGTELKEGQIVEIELDEQSGVKTLYFKNRIVKPDSIESIDFDFSNSNITAVTPSGRYTWEVVKDPKNEYTHRFLKTKMQAIGGIEQWYKEVKSAIDEDFAVALFSGVLRNAIAKYR